jgi:MOSC domain-containing protein YiiM
MQTGWDAGRVLAVCISDRKGGPKRRIGQAQLIRNFGLSGDADAGPGNYQVILMDRRYIPFDPEGIKMPPYGATGENLVIEGLDLHAMKAGTTLRCGDALLELVGPIVPPGPLFSAKVRLDGIITEDDQIEVEREPF